MCAISSLKSSRSLSHLLMSSCHCKSSTVHSLSTASPPLTDIQRVTSMKILGITVTNHLSVSEHVRNADVTCRCVQSMHALRVLRSHGLPTESLQMIFKAVVVAKLTYASPAWWGFTTADDRNRMDGLLRRGLRLRR